MLTIKTLKCNNFLSFGQNVTIKLNTPGITSIIGKRDGNYSKSNGAGKSSINSGVCYAWFGKDTKGRSADSVVNRFAGKDCWVELTWEDGTNNYLVRRTRKMKAEHKPNDLLFFKNGNNITRTTNTETQALIEQELGISYEVYLALMPGTNKLASMSDAQVKELIEALLGTSKFSDALDKTKARLKVCAAEVSRLEAAYADALNSSESLLAQKELLEQNVISKRQKELEELDASIKAVKGEKEKLFFNKPYKIDAVPIPDSSKLKQAGAACEEAQEKLASADKKSQVILHKIDYEVDELRRRKAGLLELDDCPTCFSKVAESHKASVCSEIDSQLESKLSEKAFAEKKLAVVKKKLMLELLSSKKEEALAREQYEKDFERYEEYKNYQLAKTKWESSWESLVKEEANLQARRNTCLQQADREEFSMEIFLANYEEAKRKSEEARDALIAQNNLKKDLEFWAEAYGTKGIRSRLLEQFIPYMNKKAKEYSQTLAGGELNVSISTIYQQKSKKLVEDFHVRLEMATGGDTWDAFSSGELARAATILSLTLGDVATLRAGNGLSFLFIDEVLDPVDADGSEASVGLLKSLQNKYSSIFLVTHKETLQSLFEQRIIVDKTNEYSKTL